MSRETCKYTVIKSTTRSFINHQKLCDKFNTPTHLNSLPGSCGKYSFSLCHKIYCLQVVFVVYLLPFYPLTNLETLWHCCLQLQQRSLHQQSTWNRAVFVAAAFLIPAVCMAVGQKKTIQVWILDFEFIYLCTYHATYSNLPNNRVIRIK